MFARYEKFGAFKICVNLHKIKIAPKQLGEILTKQNQEKFHFSEKNPSNN